MENIQDNSAYTPLHTACCYSALDNIKIVVSLCLVDVNIQDGSSYTPLTTACRFGHLDDILKMVVLMLHFIQPMFMVNYKVFNVY